MGTPKVSNPKVSNPNLIEAGKPYRFKPGTVNNPGGRPRGRSVTSLLRALADQPSPQNQSKTKGEMVAEMLLSAAMAGEAWAIKEFLDRTEGKSVARTEQGEPGEFDELSRLSTEELRAMLKTVT